MYPPPWPGKKEEIGKAEGLSGTFEIDIQKVEEREKQIEGLEAGEVEEHTIPMEQEGAVGGATLMQALKPIKEEVSEPPVAERERIEQKKQLGG